MHVGTPSNNVTAEERVCVVGLGFVGLTLAVVLAESGFRVCGVEIRDDVLSQIAAGKAHFVEPGLDESLSRVVREGLLTVSSKIPTDFRADKYIITVGTPLDMAKSVRFDAISEVSRMIMPHLRDGDLVILRSTVGIGTTRRLVKPILEKSGAKFEIAFCPERTLEGKACEELRTLPQIISAETPEALERISRFFCRFSPEIVTCTSIEAAEMTKLLNNIERDLRFAFANEVAQLCDFAGLDAKEVIHAANHNYPRSSIATPGPVGGPCLEKDGHILVDSMRAHGHEALLTRSAREINEGLPLHVTGVVSETSRRLPGFPSKPIIAFLGVAFKGRPATDDTRGSMAQPIAAQVRIAFPNAVFLGYDPLVKPENMLNLGITPCATLQDAVRDAAIVFILTNHIEFAHMDLAAIAKSMHKPSLIYDLWSLFKEPQQLLPRDVWYGGLGNTKLYRDIAGVTPGENDTAMNSTANEGAVVDKTTYRRALR